MSYRQTNEEKYQNRDYKDVSDALLGEDLSSNTELFSLYQLLIQEEKAKYYSILEKHYGLEVQVWNMPSVTRKVVIESIEKSLCLSDRLRFELRHQIHSLVKVHELSTLYFQSSALYQEMQRAISEIKEAISNYEKNAVPFEMEISYMDAATVFEEPNEIVRCMLDLVLKYGKQLVEMEYYTLREVMSLTASIECVSFKARPKKDLERCIHDLEDTIESIEMSLFNDEEEVAPTDEEENYRAEGRLITLMILDLMEHGVDALIRLSEDEKAARIGLKNSSF